MALAGRRSIDKSLYQASSDEATEPETLLEEMAQLQEEEFPFPNKVRSLVEDSDLSVRKTLKELGIQRSTFYNWYHRHL
jgi:hypothetical protein